MSNIDEIVCAPFIQQLRREELDGIQEAFVEFSRAVINFIHKPVAWVEKHLCLVHLNSIFHIHSRNTVSEVVAHYVELAKSLITTMKGLLVKAQEQCAEALTSFSETFRCANGKPLEWTDGQNGMYEMIQGLHAKGSFNNGEADLADITNFFEAIFSLGISSDGCYENGRTMRKRKGRKDMPKYDAKKNIDSRSYWWDDCRKELNDKMIRQDAAGDGRGVK